MTPPFALFQDFGTMELIAIAMVALIFLGSRLPGMMRSLGESVVEFKKGNSDLADELDHA